MRYKWPILKDNAALQTGFVALVVYTTLLCFQTIFPPVTFAIGLYWLFYVLSFRKERFKHIIKNPFVWVWSIYYMFVLLGLLYTNSPFEGGKDIVLKITLFLWPLAFSSWPEPVWKYKNRVVQFFAWAITISALCAVIIGVWRWNASGTKLNQLYGFLNIWPMIPNHYMALYSSFGIFAFIHLFRQKLQGLVPTILGVLVLLALLFVTSVRIQLIALPFAGLLYILYDIKDRKQRNKVMAVGVSAAIFIGVLAMLIPSTRIRINDTINEIKSINGDDTNHQTNHRIFIWKYGAEVIRENFWLGTGTGSSDLALHEKLKYCDAKFWHGQKAYYLYEKMYNYHNAYLQHFATHGLFMFLVFCVIMFMPFLIFGKTMGGIEAAFLTLCILAFLTESMLERQAGVLFFGFFYNFFFTSSARKFENNTTGK